METVLLTIPLKPFAIIPKIILHQKNRAIKHKETSETLVKKGTEKLPFLLKRKFFSALKNTEINLNNIGGICIKITFSFSEYALTYFCFLLKKSNAPNKSIQTTAVLIRTDCDMEFIFSDQDSAF